MPRRITKNADNANKYSNFEHLLSVDYVVNNSSSLFRYVVRNDVTKIITRGEWKSNQSECFLEGINKGAQIAEEIWNNHPNKERVIVVQKVYVEVTLNGGKCVYVALNSDSEVHEYANVTYDSTSKELLKVLYSHVEIETFKLMWVET